MIMMAGDKIVRNEEFAQLLQVVNNLALMILEEKRKNMELEKRLICLEVERFSRT